MNRNKPEITQEDIAKRAYEIYLQRGGMEGADLEDWLIAERELLSAQERSDRTTGEHVPLHLQKPSITDSNRRDETEKSAEIRHKTATASERSSR
jgi:hypothetical protein